MKQVVILYDSTGTMSEPEVIFYDEIHNPIPYIKSKLKSWDINDEKYQMDLANCKTIDDVQLLIEEHAVYVLQVYIIDKINPEVK